MFNTWAQTYNIKIGSMWNTRAQTYQPKIGYMCNTWALGSGENWKKWFLYLAAVFSGGFRLYEHNKSEKKLFSNFFL